MLPAARVEPAPTNTKNEGLRIAPRYSAHRSNGLTKLSCSFSVASARAILLKVIGFTSGLLSATVTHPFAGLGPKEHEE